MINYYNLTMVSIYLEKGTFMFSNVLWYNISTGCLKKQGIGVFRLVCNQISRWRKFFKTTYNFLLNKPNLRLVDLKITIL